MAGRLKSPVLRCRSNQDDAGFWSPWVPVQYFAMPLGDNVPDIHMQNRDIPADDRENG